MYSRNCNLLYECLQISKQVCLFAVRGSLPGNFTLSTLGLKLSSKVSFLMPCFVFFFSLCCMFHRWRQGIAAVHLASMHVVGQSQLITNRENLFLFFFFVIYQYHTFINLGKFLKFVTSKCYTRSQSIKKNTTNHLNTLLENKTEKASCIFSKTQTSNGHEWNPDQAEVFDSFAVAVGKARFYLPCT